MATFRTPLIPGLVWLALCILPSGRCGEPAPKGEEQDGDGKESWLSHGGGFSIEAHTRQTDGKSGANLDASFWLEADLGNFGADHWYGYVQPSLVWGEDEDWNWHAAIYQWWLSWNGNDTFEFMTGKIDSGWHFHGLPSAGPFLRLPWREHGAFSPGAFGLPDIYPLSPPSLRLAWTPVPHFECQAMLSVLDGGHEVDGMALRSAQESVWFVEAKWSNAGDEKVTLERTIGAGCWGGAGEALGAYAFADAALWRPTGNEDAGVSAFVSLAASNDPETGDWSAGALAGLVCAGLVPGREEDQLALAWSRDNRINRVKNAADLLYRSALGAGWWTQAEIQWIRQTDDAETVFGLRLGYDW